MPTMLTRIFALLTLSAYLLVGSVVVRFMMAENTSVSLSESYLNLVLPSPVQNEFKAEEIVAPEIAFAEIKIPVEVIKVAPKRMVKAPVQKKTVTTVAEIAAPVLEKNELPFHEPVKLSSVSFNNELQYDLITLYRDFTYNETQVARADIQVDKVATTQSSVESAEAEPEFFEYPVEKKTEEVKKEVEVAEVKVEEKEIVPEKVAASKEVVKAENTTSSDSSIDQSIQEIAQTIHAEPASVEAPAAVVAEDTQGTDIQPIFESDRPVEAPVAKTESVASNQDIIAFDYSQAMNDVNNQKIPTTSAVTTQAPKVNRAKTSATSSAPEQQTEEGLVPKTNEYKSAVKASKIPVAPVPEEERFAANLTVQVTGTDLKETEVTKGFELRYQDDMSEILEDYGTGEVLLQAELSQSKMTRSVTLLKRGFIPTNTDVILEDGTGSVALPMIEEETLNALQEKYEGKSPIGAVLVELEDDTELAQLDVPFGTVLTLDGDMKKTTSDDFRYQLFLGVKAGNALLTYKRGKEEVAKIIHINENELTFDSNFYEDVVDEKVRLYEDDLLSKETSPLIISEDQVQVFATAKTAKKINNHTYKLDFGTSHLAGRRYVELTHQAEPIFIGIRDNNHVTVPSENFMRFILSKVEGQKLGNRCLVQVNLTKKAEKVDVGSESVAASLMTYTQMLDSDGKFYDSLSEKTQKVIIIGENEGAPGISPDSKINIKIQYLDGTTQFLNSYCSPNTYLVEQL